MRNIFQKIKPVWALRGGLGAMFFYSGFNILAKPELWHWAVRELPAFLQEIIDAIGVDIFLRVQGVAEFAVAIIFLAWFMPLKIVRIAAAVALLEMFFILTLVGVDMVTFRDLGLLGALIALASLVFKKEEAA